LIGRFDLFYSLEHEKQQHIIEAAMEEFAEKGFKHASTNIIVEKAGISKGMLFYYFGSKDELFDFLCDYIIEFGRNEYLHKFMSESQTGDFLERCKILSEIKHKTMTGFPVLIKFLESIYSHKNEEHFKKYMPAAMELREGVRKHLYDNIDYSLFREDIDPYSTAKYIKWLMDNYEAETTLRVKNENLKFDAEDLADEWKRYYAFTDDLRKIFYKKIK